MGATRMIREEQQRRSKWKQLKHNFIDFPLYVMGHPFKGFDDIKLEGEGRTSVGVTILVVQAFIAVLNFVYRGFIDNRNDPYDLNVLMILATSIAPILLFCIGNWSITTLMDGSGTIREIFLALTYSMYLSIPLNIISIILSNVLVEDEMAVATFFSTLAMAIFLLYAFIGLIVVHDFTFLRAIAAVILSFVAILIILFITLLLASLAGEVILFFRTVYREIILNYT